MKKWLNDQWDKTPWGREQMGRRIMNNYIREHGEPKKPNEYEKLKWRNEQWAENQLYKTGSWNKNKNW